MEKQPRRCKQIPIATKIAKLRTWRDHPDCWTAKVASEKLGVAKGTLMGWKKALWSRLNDPDHEEASENRYRAKGGGRKKRLKPYELRILEFYDSCLAGGGSCTRSDLLVYARNNIPEFAILNTGTQESWMSRFVQNYQNSAVVQQNKAESDPDDQAQKPGDAAQCNDDSGCERPTETVTEKRTKKGYHSDEAKAAASATSEDGEAAVSVGVGGDEAASVSSGDENEDMRSRGLESDSGEETSQASPTSSSTKSSGNARLNNNKGVPTNRIGKMAANVPQKRGPDRPVQPEGVFARLRKRKTAEVPLLTVVHQLGTELLLIPLHQEDFDSLLPGQKLTSRVVDSFIYKHMIREDTVVCPLGTAFYMEIESAYRFHQRGAAIPEQVAGNFDWRAHRYVLLPIVGNDHYSFVVVEEPMRPDMTLFYHVTSMPGLHDSGFIFATLKWFLARKLKEGHNIDRVEDPQSFAYLTKPRQQNSTDCGVYMLHFMHKVSRYICEKKPASIAMKMNTLTSGTFTVTKAARSRADLLQRLENDKKEVFVIQ